MFGNDKEMKRHCGFVGKRAAVRRGFTLIEAMLAGAILAIGCLGVLGILIAVIQQNDVSQRRTEGMYVAELLLNRLETMAAQNKRDQQPLKRIIEQNGNDWYPLQSSSVNRYTSNGDVNGKGDYIAHYMVLSSTSTAGTGATAGATINTGDYVRGAIRVAWTKPNGSGKCENATNGTKGDCDSVSLPFVFAKKNPELDSNLPQ